METRSEASLRKELEEDTREYHLKQAVPGASYDDSSGPGTKAIRPGQSED